MMWGSAMAEYKIVVEKDYLVFASGHFITHSGTCETLHGHNYRARLELEGDLDDTGYVWDFGSVKRLMRRLVEEMDHKMLLPLQNPALHIHEEGEHVRVAYEDRRYEFPRRDVFFVPVPNTTAELLARYLLGRVRDELRGIGGGRLKALAVEVEESFGQSGWVRERMDGRGA
jgi:6-pyruvoyltetrahydropterin/6-carboxytetrahydropterin synthase